MQGGAWTSVLFVSSYADYPSTAWLWSKVVFVSTDRVDRNGAKKPKMEFLAPALLLTTSPTLREVTLPLCASVFMAIKYV